MPRPTLSLCMIVRDEATMLPDCLASVRGIVDQIVIVDTGSKDRTREIGEAAGAVVIEHPWQGNFAAARNAALPHATGDFILILDADERLAPTAGNVLHAAVQDPTFHLGFLPLHNADRLNATPEQILSGAARRGDPVLLPRLLKKTPDLQWQGIVHENVDAWILKDGRRAVEVPAPIIHLGNVDEISIARKKTERNTTLLARAVALSPEDPQLRSWLARELLRTGQADRARQEAEVAWKSMVTALNAGLKPAVVLTASLVGFLRLEDNDWDGVLEVINTTAPYAGDHPNLFLLEGVARQQRAAEGDLERAAQVLRQAIAQHGKMFTAESMPGATSWSARMQLGFVALRAGAPEQALAQFSEALSANPEQIHSRLGAAESLAAMGRHGDALQVVEPALPTGGSDGWIIAAAAAAALNQIDTARALLNRADAAPTDPRRVAMRDNVRAVLYGETLLKELTGGQMNVGAVQAPEMIADGEDRFARGDLDGAVDRFVRALTAAPGSATAWINLGVSLHAAGLIDGSRRALQQAVRLDPTAREGWMSLGHLSAESGRIDQAAEAFRRVLDLNPGDEEAYAALVILGLEGDAEQDTAPLLSVVFIDTASKATITGALDHLALQDLHPSLFEVVLNTQETSHKRAFTVRHSDQPVEDARGRWLVVFQSTDRPQRDVLRKHLAAQVTEDGPVAVQGARIFDAERIASEPMVAAINTLPQTGAPLSNLSIPRTHIDILPRLRWKPTGAGVKIVRDSAITCLRGEPVTVEGFLAAQRSGGEANRRAWQRDPSIPVHNLPGNPGTEEGWLAARIQFERFQPQVDAARSRIDAARSVGGSIPADALVIVARQAWRAGLLSDVLPSRGQRALSSALTSIIIPNLNGMPHLIGCVDSIRRHTRGPVELIVVDNGSNDGSLEWLQEQSDIVLIEMGENVGAPAARNRGLAVARGETILFCDNDVIFTPRWRPLLLRHLETYDDVGMVGPMSDYVIGPQKVDPMPPAQVALDDYATAFTRQRTGQHIYTRRLILFFIMARREVFDQIGGIDEGYGRWGFEDDDLCVRVNLAGYRMRVAGDCFIRHLGSQTARTARINYDELLQKNWQVFKNKWGLDPALPYGPYDHEVIAAQTFSAEALFVPYKNGVRSPKTPIKLVSMR